MQTKKQQGKYITVVKGKILDVCVDCRKKSKTFGKFHKVILSEKMVNLFLYLLVSYMDFLSWKKKIL